jgi:ubiquinol-cytochrome c reductase iron-sulfur subunit
MSTEPGTPVREEDLVGRDDAELTSIGAELDGVHIAHRAVRFAPGSVGERRAERIVAGFFLLTAVSATAFTVVFIVWPWQSSSGGLSYLYTPLLGITMALALFGLGGGIVAWGKLVIPHEEAVQERHDGFSTEVDRVTTAATLTDGLEMTGLARRSVIKRSLGLAGAAFGVMAVIPLGGLIKKPRSDADGLMHTPWGAGVRMVYLDGVPIKPEDLRPGSMETVFPDPLKVPGGATRGDTPVMLIRLDPDTQRVPRAGQEDYSWPRDASGKSIMAGAYVAFSKICTHLGCPTSLYEHETARILCPCHQSQFNVLRDAKPVFGPATRSLPMLPIEVDEQGYFRARGDFREPVGPAFWERPNYD